MQFRGFMIDTPRGIETMDYYFRLIDFLQKEKFNSIIFRLTDDEGSAYRFTSHPELKMCEGAFTARELRSIVKNAQSKGIELIPEIESFGHSKYITQTERNKFLNDGPEGANFKKLFPWSSEENVRDIILKNKQIPNGFGEIINVLTVCKNKVQKNKADFEALLLTVEFMDHIYKRENGILAFVNSEITDMQSAQAYLKKVALEDQKMLSRINLAWRVGRRGNPDLTSRDYMWSFYLASGYSKHLSENPSEFLKLLERNK